jgi:thymidylate synthase
MQRILDEGEIRTDRTGTGTLSLFAQSLRHDLRTGFPLLTTKKVHFRSIVTELLWFIQGETNIRPLLLKKNTIWSEWPHAAYIKATGDQIDIKTFERRIRDDEDFATKWGDLGPVYGAMWRRWPDGKGGYIDQLAEAERLIRKQPDSRRIIITAWNPAVLGEVALPPCHAFMQFRVSSDGHLDCHLYQRSADLFLGVPFNIASYALLTSMLAHSAGLEAREIIITMGDCHLYLNHLEQARLQISRKEQARVLPTLLLGSRKPSITEYGEEDIILQGYDPHPAISAPVAV